MHSEASAILIPEPDPNNPVGYSCQTYLSRYLSTQWFKSEFYVYFSKEFNPVENGDSSNPLQLYEWYDRAIKRSDINHPKIRYHRVILLWVIDQKRRQNVIDAVTAFNLARNVANASLRLFRPEIWKLNLNLIANRIVPTNNFPDEFVISDLHLGEFDIIIP